MTLSFDRMPRFWMNETSGVLAPVIQNYLVRRRPMTTEDIAVMRAYLRQWVMAESWHGGEDLEALRASVDKIATHADINTWLEQAIDIGIDPL